MVANTIKEIQNKKDAYKKKRSKTFNVQGDVLMQSLEQNFLMVLSGFSQEFIYETKLNILHKKTVKKNLQFKQLVFSFHDKTKSSRESLTFESWMLIFAAHYFSLEQKVHHIAFAYCYET